VLLLLRQLERLCLKDLSDRPVVVVEVVEVGLEVSVTVSRGLVVSVRQLRLLLLPMRCCCFFNIAVWFGYQKGIKIIK
jgi:hypothetical protein